jgi:GntR family transcriptional regulator, transcriptional repressor for pyruvate dehydrogenase complex
LTTYRAINPHRLHEDIVRQLASLIVSGEHPAGTLLPTETELTARFGVSRTVVREAIRMLVSKGLVTVRQGSGMWVQPPDRWNLLDPLVLTIRLRAAPDEQLIEDLFEARRTIEVKVAMLAAKRRTPEDISTLGSTVRQMREIGQSDARAYGQLDLQFHHGLFLAARNQVLQQMAWSTVETMVIAGARSSIPEAIRHDESQRGHETIFEAVRAGDVVLAREEVCRLLEITQDTLRRSLLINVTR